jgi:hypothetical protein
MRIAFCRLKPLNVPVASSLICFALTAAATAQEAPKDQRYGLFGLLDHRSTYGTFWFVEPLRAPEMDVDRELRIDYFHSEAHGRQLDTVKAELEYNVGLLTLELAVPYETESVTAFNAMTHRTDRARSRGTGGIELAARHPVFQYVSNDNSFDYTLAGALEVAIPSGSPISKDTEVVPQVFHLLRLGEHLSVEASLGLSMLLGPEAGGTNTLEYALVLGYNLEHQDLPLPGILRTIPIFEMQGERALSGMDHGTNRLFGTAGFRLNFKSIGRAQPRIGFGYVFPMDQGARREMSWGIISSLVFEF